MRLLPFASFCSVLPLSQGELPCRKCPGKRELLQPSKGLAAALSCRQVVSAFEDQLRAAACKAPLSHKLDTAKGNAPEANGLLTTGASQNVASLDRIILGAAVQ